MLVRKTKHNALNNEINTKLLQRTAVDQAFRIRVNERTATHNAGNKKSVHNASSASLPTTAYSTTAYVLKYFGAQHD